MCVCYVSSSARDALLWCDIITHCACTCNRADPLHPQGFFFPHIAAFRFGRFLKLPAALYYYSRWETFSQMPSLTRLLRLSVSIFLSVHLIACCYVGTVSSTTLCGR